MLIGFEKLFFYTSKTSMAVLLYIQNLLYKLHRTREYKVYRTENIKYRDRGVQNRCEQRVYSTYKMVYREHGVHNKQTPRV